MAVKHGFAFKGEYFSSDPTGRVVLTPGNFHEQGGFKRTRGKEKYYTESPPPDFVLREGDIVVAMTEQAPGLMGSSALIPAGDVYLHNQRVGLVEITDPRRLDQLFAYYLFNSSAVRKQIEATATGAKVRHTAPGRIEAVEVGLPPLSTQRRVGSLLASYDDLIDNNMRRVLILEEMAQAIYREWFVEFRSPGHEQVGLHETSLGMVPTNWEPVTLNTVAHVNQRTQKATAGIGEIRYLDIASVTTGGMDEPTPMEFAEAPGRARRKITHGDVIWSTVRPNRRSYALLIDPPENLIVSTGFAVLTAHAVPFSFLYRCVTTDDFVGYLTNRATGAAYPAVTGKVFEEAFVLLPPDDLLAQFSAIVEPIDLLIAQLDRASLNLRATRDFLLPRLISGDVDVSNLDTHPSGLVA